MLTDFRKLFRQSLVYGLGTLSTKLAGFVLIPLYTIHFSVAQFGVLGLLEVSAQVVIAFVGFSLYSGFFRWYWDNSARGRQESLFFTVTVFQILVAAVAYFVSLPFLPYISGFILGSAQYAGLFRLMLISSLLQLAILMPITLLRLQERPWLFTWANVAQLVFGLSLTVYFVAYRNMGLEGIYYGQIIGSLAGAAILLGFTVKNMKFRFEFHLLRDILVYCFPLFFSGLALVILNVTDRYSINYFGKLSDVGLYSYGFKLANTLQVFLVTSVNFAIQPMIYRMMNAPDNKRFYSKLLTYYTFATLIFALALMVYGLEISKLFAKRVEYFDAWMIIPFIAFSVVFGMMKDVAVTGLNITRKTSLIAYTVIAAALLNLVLNALLIPWMGNLGAATSKLASMMVFFLSTVYFAQKQFYVPYEFKRLLLMLSVAAGLVVISLAFNNMTVFPRVLLKAALILSFPFLLYATGFYEASELNLLRSGWNKWKDPHLFKENFRRLFSGNTDQND